MPGGRRPRTPAWLCVAAIALGLSGALPIPGTATPSSAGSNAVGVGGSVVFSVSQVLTGNVYAANVTIAAGVTLTTNGHSILATGAFVNHGTVLAGLSSVTVRPHSFGGSGGGAARRSGSPNAGQRTQVAGGSAYGPRFGGGTPLAPTNLSLSLVQHWNATGIQNYLGGAAGGRTYLAAGGNGSYGLYIRATTIVTGLLDARGGAGGGRCLAGGLSGGGGGGVILLVYGAGGIVPGRLLDTGGLAAHSCTSRVGYWSGPGGNGQLLTLSQRGNATAAPTWTELTPMVLPPPVTEAGMAYDPAVSSTLLFGGIAANGTVSNQTWEFAVGRWVRLNLSVSPSARLGPAMAYDPSTGAVVLFGGATTIGYSSTPGLNDTWSFANGSWTQLHPKTSPSGRSAASMTYVPWPSGLILFGGASYGYYFISQNDTWRFANGTWTRIALSAAVPPRAFAGMAFDPGLNATLLWGGWHRNSGGCGHRIVGRPAGGAVLRTSEQFNGSTWSPASGAMNLTARRDLAMAYDPAVAAIVLFGGYARGGCHALPVYLAETWTHNATGWTQAMPSTSPPPMAGLSMVYDASLGKLLVFGVPYDGPASPETWTYG